MKIQVNHTFANSRKLSISCVIVEDTNDKVIVFKSTAKVRALSKSDDLTLILVMNLILLVIPWNP